MANEPDDLDAYIDELAETDPLIYEKVEAALERRELAHDLAERRRDAGLTQCEVAERMGTSQGQVARFESGADTRMSTVARYATAVGARIAWTIEPVRKRRARPAARATSVPQQGGRGGARRTG
ncbi:MAG: helix-turn-helix domain-containing protein [Acidimicrobiia bacterium]|nr:helix-turn-helix domain-containing protein [Acidimicrobiia bacterium]